MRRKLAYSNPVLSDSVARLGSLPQGDWHVSKTGGKLVHGPGHEFGSEGHAPMPRILRLGVAA